MFVRTIRTIRSVVTRIPFGFDEDFNRVPEARQPEIYRSTQKAGNRGIFPVGEPGGNTIHGRPAGDGRQPSDF